MVIQALEKKAFAEFGTILTMDSVAAVSDKQEFDFHDTAQGIQLATHCCTGLLACRSRPKIVVEMERHHDTSEVIVALDGDMVMALAPADDDLQDHTRIRAFLIRQGEAIVMAPGTWHWIPFPCENRDTHALVLFKDGTGADDLHFRKLSTPLTLD